MNDIKTKLDLSPYTENMLWELYFSGIISQSEMAAELRQRDEAFN